MTNAQLVAAVNAYREQDLANYQSGKGPVYMHNSLRPDKTPLHRHEGHFFF